MTQIQTQSHPASTVQAPYYDDFRDAAGFHRVLFNPSKGIQAREMIQSQTIAQSQLETLAKSLYKNGSKVLGAETAIQECDFARVYPEYNGSEFDPADWVGRTIGLVGQDDDQTPTGSFRGRVVFVDQNLTSDDPYYVVFYQVISGSGDDVEVNASGESTNRFVITDWEDTSTPSPNAKIIEDTAGMSVPADYEAVGRGQVITVTEGKFFVSGFMVYTPQQSIAAVQSPGEPIRIYKPNTNLSSRIGLVAEYEIVTSNTDQTLFDPAKGYPNYNASGADRYRISLVMSQYPVYGNTQNSVDTAIEQIEGRDFIELVRIVNGALVKNVKYPIYSDIENTLARRTHDESGSYTVRPYVLNLHANLDGNDFDSIDARLVGGKAYVFGYEAENIGSISTEIPRAITSRPFTNTQITQDVGNYIFASPRPNMSDTDVNFVLAAIVSGTPMDLFDVSETKIGTARVRYLGQDAINAVDNKIYLYNVEMTSGNRFEDVRLIGLIGTPNQYYFVASRYEIVLRDNYVYGADYIPGTTTVTITNGVTSWTALVEDWIPSSPGASETRLLLRNITGNAPQTLVGVGYTVSGIVSGRTITYSLNGADQRAYVVNQNANSAIVPIPGANRVKSIERVSYNIVRPFYITSDGSGVGTVMSAQSGTVFQGDGVLSDDRVYFTVNRIDGAPSFTRVASNTLTITVTGGSSAAITGLPANGNFVVYAVITVLDETLYRTKTVSTATQTLTTASGIGTLTNYDIIGITSIFDGVTDVTNQYRLDNGQRENVYLPGRIIRKSGTTSATLTVTYTYYTHAGSHGPFIVSSYPAGQYPTFTSEVDGRIYDLLDCLDFRPRYISGAYDVNQYYTGDGQSNLDHTCYLSRIDKLVLYRDRSIGLLEGTPDVNPKEPRDSEDGMTLYTIRVNANTRSETDLVVQYINNQRYTMSDIRKLDKRINRLEDAATLSLQEQSVANLDITDEAGLTRFKTGILVDPFRGHSIGDVLNPDYNCSIDFNAREMRPAFTSEQFAWDITVPSAGEVTLTTDNILIRRQLNPVAIISQPLASKSLNVNPYNVTSWLGSMSLQPASDNWIDQVTLPDVLVNISGDNDAWDAIARDAGPWGTQWNDWETLSIGQVNTVSESTNTTRQGNWFTRETVTRTVTDETIAQTRSGEQNIVVASTITQQLGDRIVSSEIIPFCRARTITVTASGLKPATPMFAFFDGVTVSEFCSTVDRNREILVGTNNTTTILRYPPQLLNTVEVGTTVDITTSGGVTKTGLSVVNVDEVEGYLVLNGDPTLGAGVIAQTADLTFKPTTGKNHIFTNEFGSCELVFELPGGVFRTGERVFRLIDNNANDLNITTTNADERFFAQGLLQSVENTTLTTRVPTVQRASVNDSQVLTNRFVNDAVTESVRWFRDPDPLAQTFLIDPAANPQGIFLHSVDLFFKTKDQFLPVMVQIRPVVNGYPHSNMVLPFARVNHNPNVVKVSQNPTLADATRFEFSTPVHLPPGEYAFVVLTNSNNYELWAAGIGETIVGTTDKVSGQPYTGSLFMSQNARTWTADQTSDLMFVLNRSEFSLGEANDSYIMPLLGTTAQADLVSVQSQDVQPVGTYVVYAYRPADEVFTEITPNTNTPFRSRKYVVNDGSADTSELRVTLRTDNSKLTPCVDLERVGLIAVRNEIQDIPDTTENNRELEAHVSDSDQRNEFARYITRLIQLEPGFESNGIRVLLDANLPFGTGIKVYARLVPLGITDYDSVGYTELTLDGSFVYSERPTVFTEYNFRKELLSSEYDFNRFSIKVVLYSTSTSVIPRVKNFRAISVI